MSFQHRFVQGLGATKRMHPSPWLGRILLAITLLVLGTQAASADVSCTESNGQWTCSCTQKQDNNGQFIYQSLDDNNQKPWKSAQTAPDLVVSGWCRVPLSQTLYFRNINIHGYVNVSGVLQFYEDDAGKDQSDTHFWASSIIIENYGAFRAWDVTKAMSSCPSAIVAAF